MRTKKSENLKTKKMRNQKPQIKHTNTILSIFSMSKLDQYFGVYKENVIYMMGNEEITVDNQNNIWLDSGTDSYKRTFGLSMEIDHFKSTRRLFQGGFGWLQKTSSWYA